MIGEGVLPANRALTYVAFGDDFNQAIGEGVLPAYLSHLTFGEEFRQEIDEVGHLPFVNGNDSSKRGIVQ